MQRINSFFSNILTFVLLLALGLGVTWFVTNQFRQPATQQKPEATPALSNLVNTPQPTRVVTVIPVVVTIIPTPTPAPSPTPTPTFEPLSDKPIMGFVFKSPQEIPSTRNSVGHWEIIEWLPDSSEEVLLEGPLSLDILNVISKTMKTYATVKEPGNIRHPVWLPENQSVAYLSHDFEANQTILLQANLEQKPKILLSNVESPLIPIDKGQSVAVYSTNDRALKGISLSKQETIIVPAPLNNLFRSENGGFEAVSQVAAQPNGEWIAHYSINGLEFVNSRSGEEISIELGGHEFNPLWAMNVKWSPDGKKLALIVTEGKFPSPFSDLYVLDWAIQTLQKMEDNFTYITDIAWSPDSQHLLFKPIIDERDGFPITALYLTNLSTLNQFIPVPIPIDGLTGTNNSLSWSSDGQTVLVQYFHGQEAAIYKINVVTR